MNPTPSRAQRATYLADLARTAVADNPAAPATLSDVADHLDTAARALREEQPPILDGIVITNTLPAEAWMALTMADQHLPGCTGYVTGWDKTADPAADPAADLQALARPNAK